MKEELKGKKGKEEGKRKKGEKYGVMFQKNS
jgi:hypothetical protein